MHPIHPDHSEDTKTSIRPIVNKKEQPTYFLEKYMTKIYKSFLPNSDTPI